MNFAQHPLKAQIQSLMADPTPTEVEVAAAMQEEKRQQLLTQAMQEQEFSRRVEEESALREAQHQALMQELSFSAALKKLEHEERLAQADAEDVPAAILAALGTGTGKMSEQHKKQSRRDPQLGLVGFDSPDDVFREVYLQTEKPTIEDRLKRFGLGGLLGAGAGGAAAGAASLLGHSAKGKALAGLLAGGAGLGALVGAALPTRVTEGYDPDMLLEVPEREERRARAVMRELGPGEMPGNVAMGSTFPNLRGFGGGSPSFAYAADIDEMLAEDPNMASALLGKNSSMADLEATVIEEIRPSRVNGVHVEKERTMEKDGPRPVTRPGQEEERLKSVAPLKEVVSNDRLLELAARIKASKMGKAQAKASYEGLEDKADTFEGKVEHLRGKEGADNPEGLVAWLEHKATGKWPGEHRRKKTD